jgi:hypothetical protein
MASEDSKDLGKLTLQECISGQYFGKEAQKNLNKIAASLHKEVIEYCLKHSKRELLFFFYDEFDAACYNIITGAHWKTDDYSLFQAVETAPSVISYLINTVISCESQFSAKPQLKELKPIVKSAQLLLQVCNYSNFLFYSDREDGFKLSRTGEISFILSEKTREIQNRMLQRTGRRRINVRNKKLWGQPKGWEDLCAEYDYVFEKKYGLKLLDVANTITYGFEKVKKNGAILSSYRDLVKRFRKPDTSKAVTKKAISLFELDPEDLRLNWKFYKLYEMRPSVSRQPIVRLSGNITKDGEVVFGPHTLMYALNLLFADVDRAVIDFGEFSEKHMEKKGLLFEQKIQDLFRDYGFNVLHLKDTPNDIGDIDCLAYYNPKGLLFIVETKGPKIDLSLQKVKWQIERTKKWHQQLTRKSEWVRKNLSRVSKLLNFELKNLKEIKAVVVVQVPTFCEEEYQHKIVSLEELYYMLEELKIPT